MSALQFLSEELTFWDNKFIQIVHSSLEGFTTFQMRCNNKWLKWRETPERKQRRTWLGINSCNSTKLTLMERSLQKQELLEELKPKSMIQSVALKMKRLLKKKDPNRNQHPVMVLSAELIVLLTVLETFLLVEELKLDTTSQRTANSKSLKRQKLLILVVKNISSQLILIHKWKVN